MKTYKEVFQLAQDKGYKAMFTDLLLPDVAVTNKMGLLELTLIAKWLRDEHKRIVDVRHNPHSQGNSGLWEWHTSPIYAKGHILTSLDTPNRQGAGCGLATYEDALLNGIDAALLNFKP